MLFDQRAKSYRNYSLFISEAASFFMHRRCASFPKQKALHLQCNGADSRNTSTFCSQSAALLQKAVTFRVSLRENLPQAAFRSLARNRTPLAHQRVAPRKTKKALQMQCFSVFLEAPPRIELGVKVLQTSALPLGYGAE